MARPNLFVVGAPKSGTTSLHRYLGQHPDIYMSPAKEPRHFCADLDMDPGLRICDREQYLCLFEGAGSAAWRGESSVYYLYSKQAPAEILTMSPDARFIIMLRNPVDMVFALHGQFLYSGNETISDFPAALAAEERRSAGLDIPRSAQFPMGLQYTKMGRYHDHVEHYLNAAGRDRVFVALFDNLVTNARELMRRVFRFLDIDESAPLALTPHNRRKDKDMSMVRLTRFLKSHPRMASVVHRLPQPSRLRARKVLASLGGLFSVTAPEEVPPETRVQLATEFRPDVERLGRLLGTDLSFWSEL